MKDRLRALRASGIHPKACAGCRNAFYPYQQNYEYCEHCFWIKQGKDPGHMAVRYHEAISLWNERAQQVDTLKEALDKARGEAEHFAKAAKSAQDAAEYWKAVAASATAVPPRAEAQEKQTEPAPPVRRRCALRLNL